MKNKLINEASKKNIDIEILDAYQKNVAINTLNGKLELFQINDLKKYIIKAIKNNRCAKIVVEDLKNIEQIINSLEEIFITQDNDNKNIFSKGNIKSTIKNKKINYNAVIEDLKSLEEIKNSYKEIKSIEIYFNHGYFDKSIVNKLNNCDMQESDYYISFDVSLTLNKDNINKVLYLSYYEKEYDFKEFREYLISSLDKALIKLNSKSIKTNKYNIILTNKVVGNILSTFVDSFQSKGIYLQTSVLTNKLNEKIFSDKINIIEDSKNGFIKVLFDNEGNNKEYQELVKNGVFVKEINDLEYAIKTNSKPTGNAGGVNNLYIAKGDCTFEDLVKMLDNGIIIDEVFGLHSGIDKKNGNISLQAEGLLVENGKITKGLDMIILSTNLFEVFSNVTRVGNDLSKEDIEVIAPSLLLHDITITGKE